MTNPAPRPDDLPPGFDEEDPYEDADIEDFPEWWQRNIEEFQAHTMRPYRPPKLADGSVLPKLSNELEAEHGISIRIQAVNPHENPTWEVWVDNRCIGTVERYRSSEGRTVYEITSDEFESMITDAIE